MQGRSREATIGAHIQGWRRRLMDDTSIREGRKEGGKANEEGGGVRDSWGLDEDTTLGGQPATAA